jgi:hypothetical protein
MIIITEKKLRKAEGSSTIGGNRSWDIAWKDALGVFKILSNRRDISFEEIGPDRPPLGNQPILGLKISGNDLVVYGKETGYIIFGNQVARIVRRHFESPKVETITILFSSGKELKLGWKS